MSDQATRPPSRASTVARLTIAPIFIVVGAVHLARPELFAPLMPSVVPYPMAAIALTGLAEIVGAIALFVPRTRALAGMMLALYAVSVFPVNISHAVRDLSAGPLSAATGTGLGWAYHYPRLFAQPFICWWALVAGAVWWAPTIARPRD